MNTKIVPQELTEDMLRTYAHREAVLLDIQSGPYVKGFMEDDKLQHEAQVTWDHLLYVAPHLSDQVDTRALGSMPGNRNWNKFKLEWEAIMLRTALPRKLWKHKPWSGHLLQDILTEATRAGIYTMAHIHLASLVLNVILGGLLVWQVLS